jgi:hypothetical protein
MLHVSFKCIRVHVFRGCCTDLLVTVKIQGRLQLLYLLYHKQRKNFLNCIIMQMSSIFTMHRRRTNLEFSVCEKLPADQLPALRFYST